MWSKISKTNKFTLKFSFSIWLILLLLFVLFELGIGLNESYLLNEMRTRFPELINQEYDILNILLLDRSNRFLFFLPLLAIISLLLAYIISNHFLQKISKPLERSYLKVFKDQPPADELISETTARKMLELRQQLGKEQDNFFSLINSVSHELKTPLFALKSSIEVVRLNEANTKKDYEHFLQMTDILTTKLQNITDSLLILAKNEQDLQGATAVDLSQILTESLTIIQAKYKQLKFKFQTNIAAGIKITAQQKFMATIFLNILDNACKYSHKGGQIKVSLTAQARKIVFLCQDQGIGIAKSDLAKIGGQFFRSQNALEAGIEGSGIGLATVKKILAAYQAQLKISSTVSKGTEVRITFKQA